MGKQPRAFGKLEELGRKLISLQDGLADLKSYFDGHGDPTDAQLTCINYVFYIPLISPSWSKS